MEEEYMVTYVTRYRVKASGNMDAIDKAQLLRSGSPDYNWEEGDSSLEPGSTGVRKIQPWEGDETLPYWHVAVQDLSIQAPTDNEAATLAHEKTGCHELEIKTLYAVSQE